MNKRKRRTHAGELTETLERGESIAREKVSFEGNIHFRTVSRLNYTPRVRGLLYESIHDSPVAEDSKER